MEEISHNKARTSTWDLVILGKGFSGIVNCITRMHTANLPTNVLFVGQADPWSNYADHEMGQFGSLLSLPGYYEALCGTCDPNKFKSSAAFAKSNSLHFEKLVQNKQYNICHINGLVKEKLRRVGEKWLVMIESGDQTITISTTNLDICTGPGIGRPFDPTTEHSAGPWSPAIAGAFNTAILADLMDRACNKAFVAEDFLKETQKGERVVVVGEGPLAANIVEHGLRIGYENVVWITRPDQLAKTSFPASRRYDGLVQNAECIRGVGDKIENYIARRDNVAIHDAIDTLQTLVKPSDERLQIVLGEVAAVQESNVTVNAVKPFDLSIIDSSNVETLSEKERKSFVFSKLVLSASSIDHPNERLAASWLVSSHLMPIENGGLGALTEDDIFLGLSTYDQSLRILGATARNKHVLRQIKKNLRPGREEDRFSKADNAYVDWHDSLCQQARMPNAQMGITVSAATIARANHYYNSANNDLDCIQTARLSNDLSDKRSTSIPPFRSEDALSGSWIYEPVKL